MLGGPFDRELGAFIISHGGTVAVASLGIVLRVEQSIVVVSIGVSLVKSIIASSGVLHVAIPEYQGNVA